MGPIGRGLKGRFRKMVDHGRRERKEEMRRRGRRRRMRMKIRIS